MEAVVSDFVVDAEPSVRATFLRRTYAHLAGAIAAFLALEAVLLNVPWVVNLGLAMTQGWWWLAVLGVFMVTTTLADRWAHQAASKTEQYIALGIAVAAEAMLFVPVIYLALAATGDGSMLLQAGALTGCLFVATSLVAFVSGRDFSVIRPALYVVSMLALGLIVLGIVFGFTLGLWFSFAMVGVASISILVRTAQIVHSYRPDQHVAASLGLFGALMLLFWYILDIVLALASE